MKVLFVTPLVPYPPRKGTAVRIWKLMEAMARAHHVSLVTLAEPSAEALEAFSRLNIATHAVPQPHRRSWQRLAQFLSGQADLIGRLASRGLQRKLAQLLTEGIFDVLQVEGLEMAEAW
ncbi:MAG: hypothetical protein HYX89_05545, partial [Chloroflexi bacterium]|nr:hypothetical protein [Chloroflexota bacterium]